MMMTLFKPAIAIMNYLKYPQKFFLISLLFILPLALVTNLLLLEINSRIEFTQKEIYGNAYLRPLNQLWQNIPRRQLILQRQFYKITQSFGQILHSQSQELADLQRKIDQALIKLTNVDHQLGKTVQTNDKLQDLKFAWLGLRDSQEFASFRNYDVLIEQLDYFRIHIVDFFNLILDPEIDTYYLMDASAVKLPEMQKLLYQVMQIEAEVIFKQEISNTNREQLITCIGLLNSYNDAIAANLERAFKNNP
ncbi:MAG: diguanylate cyclase, partial [Pseudanabaena sp.]